VNDRTGLSRGDRNRNARLARLRVLLPSENAIVGIDLAGSKQAAVVTDHDSRVIARRRVTARAWELGGLLDWALARALAAGFASVTVAGEPTGHRWRVLDQLAAQRSLALVCLPAAAAAGLRSRESEDLTRDKSDTKDAVLIARLASELRCYEPERGGAVWTRLRHLGARRMQLTIEATGQVNQVRDLLECAWPAVLSASGAPFRSSTWWAALAVTLDRSTGDLARVRRLGPARFEAAVRRELDRWAATRPVPADHPRCLRGTNRRRRGDRAQGRGPGTSGPGQWVVDLVRRTASGNGRDGAWLRVSRHGFMVGEARDWDGVAALGADIADLRES
jgi:transposase